MEKSLVIVKALTMALSRSYTGEPYEPPFRHWLRSKPSCYPLPLWIIQMDTFDNRTQIGIWCSILLSFWRLYKMCLNVDANGSGAGKVHTCRCSHI